MYYLSAAAPTACITAVSDMDKNLVRCKLRSNTAPMVAAKINTSLQPERCLDSTSLFVSP